MGVGKLRPIWPGVMGIIVGVAALLIGFAVDSSMVVILATFLLLAQVRLRSGHGASLSLVPGCAFVALSLGAGIDEVLVAIVVSGLLPEALTRLRRGFTGRRRDPIRETASPLLMVVLWWATTTVSPWMPGDVDFVESAGVISLLALSAIWLAGDAVIRAVADRSRKRSLARRFGVAARGSVLPLMMLSASATLAALWNYSAAWAVAISIGPFLVTYSLIISAERARRIEELTIRALGRLPEAAGVSPTNHSSDVAELAVEMAVVRGMAADTIVALRRAAVLHDVGLVCAPSRWQDGPGFSESDKADWSSEIVGSSSALLAEAEIIRQAGALYRVPGSDPDQGADPRAHILRAACAFNGLVASGTQTTDAVEDLYSEPFVHAPWAVGTIRAALRDR